MANYRRGWNRIFYRTKGFADVLNVEVYFYSPKLEKSETLTMTKLEDSLYYIDYYFDCIGDFLGVFLEDSVKAGTHVFKVEHGGHIFFEGQPLL